MNIDSIFLRPPPRAPVVVHPQNPDYNNTATGGARTPQKKEPKPAEEPVVF